MPKRAGDVIRQLKNIRPQIDSFKGMTLGIVVDTNDPQQMGRIRAVCPTIGDDYNSPIKDIPWAKYVSPFGGHASAGTRGPTNEGSTEGPVMYGMWGIPKVGAQVLIASIDGNPAHRIWLGCIYGEQLPHTMPHGRYTYQRGGEPDGPLSSAERPIQPLYDNLTEAFGSRNSNFEWRSRGVDNQCARVDGSLIDNTISRIEDDRNVAFTEADGNQINSNQGYARSRIAPELTSELTGLNYDSQIYSWTTPGFHAFSMDDKPDNCRMRFRTSSGHQILMDDTNERIYIATAKGNNWIEMDQNGNIDIYTEKRVSVHAKEDINFTTDKAFRVKAEEGIHMQTPGEFRLHVGTDSHIKTVNDMFVETGNDTHCTVGNSLFVVTTTNTDIKTGAILNIQSGSHTNMDFGGNWNVGVGTTTNINSGNTINLDGSEIHLNDGIANGVNLTITSTKPYESFWTNRVPEHEPWGRIMMIETDKNSANQHIPELSYTDPTVGQVELGTTIDRGPFWHR